MGGQAWASALYLDTGDSLRFARDASVSEASSSLPLGTSCSGARRHSAGYCFAPDCERVRVDGGAAPGVPQGRAGRREASPLLSSRRGYSCRAARRPGKRALQKNRRLSIGTGRALRGRVVLLARCTSRVAQPSGGSAASEGSLHPLRGRGRMERKLTCGVGVGTRGLTRGRTPECPRMCGNRRSALAQ